MSSTIVQDLITALEGEISAVLGASYTPMQYVVDVEKNSYNTNDKRYGVRALEALEVPSVTKHVRMNQVFEVVLSRMYRESKISDSELRNAENDLKSLMHDIYKRLINNKAGAPAIVINITDLSLQISEILEESKVVVQRATFGITYRFILI